MPRKLPYFRPAGSPTQAEAAASYRLAPGRAEDNRFYASAPWRRLRLAFLARHPLCADCLKQGRATPAAHAHHVEPRKQRPDLALSWANLEALCLKCHNGRPVR